MESSSAGNRARRAPSDGRKPEEGTAFFAEMASPGTVFEGSWRESEFLAAARRFCAR